MASQVVVSKIPPAKKLGDLFDNIDEHLLSALRNSIYPGAKDESIAMVLAYCKSKNYDPLAKCCHIVPMRIRDQKTKNYEFKDIIMTGLNAYRIDAHRTGQYAGLSLPTFGPIITEVLGGKKVSYPEWCMITTKRLLSNGTIAEFSAVEFWKENFATKKDSDEPTEIWLKRKRGQIAKCTEVQSIRKGFPEVGNQLTFEEMEGKELTDSLDVQLKITDPNAIVNQEHLKVLNNKINESGVDEEEMKKFFSINKFNEMTITRYNDVCQLLDRKISRKSNSIVYESKSSENSENIDSEQQDVFVD